MFLICVIIWCVWIPAGQDGTQNYNKFPCRILSSRGHFYIRSRGQHNFGLQGQIQMGAGVTRARVFQMQSTTPVLTTVSQLILENLSFIGMHPSQASTLLRQSARNWKCPSQYHPASRLSITLICSIDLFACSVCNRTHKLLTNFSKNWFYLLPGPLRTWKN